LAVGALFDNGTGSDRGDYRAVGFG
jgi:hypothetical protein